MTLPKLFTESLLLYTFNKTDMSLKFTRANKVDLF